MRQKKKGKTLLKFGSSKNPERRLEEIKKKEGNENIELISSKKANKMRSAETAVQRAFEKEGLKKDKTRGGATDWYVDPQSTSNDKIKKIFHKTVRKHNAKFKQ